MPLSLSSIINAISVRSDDVYTFVGGVCVVDELPLANKILVIVELIDFWHQEFVVVVIVVFVGIIKLVELVGQCGRVLLGGLRLAVLQ